MTEKIGGGLLPLKKDSRDFKLSKRMGGFPLHAPDFDFEVAKPLEIKNQFDSDFCTAFASCAVSEDQEGVPLSPEWFFAQVKRGDVSWGSDLRQVCKTATKEGFLAQEDAPYTLKDMARDWLLNDKNWPDFGDKPLQHKKKSYFAVDINGDIFDSFRSALWFYGNQKCSILTGCLWENTWTGAPNGVIPENPGTKQYGHSFKIFGQKNINGKLYLAAQLSNGTEIGDGGIFYFSREVANRAFKGFGAFMFLDDDPEEIKKQQWDWKTKLLNFIKKLWH